MTRRGAALSLFFRRLLVLDTDPQRDGAPWPDGRNFFRGLLIVTPLSGLLWWGLIAWLWSA